MFVPYDDVRENEIIYFPLGNSINLLMITSQVKSSLVVKIIVFFIAKIVILSEDNNKNVPIRMSYFVSSRPRDSSETFLLGKLVGDRNDLRKTSQEQCILTSNC